MFQSDDFDNIFLDETLSNLETKIEDSYLKVEDNKSNKCHDKTYKRSKQLLVSNDETSNQYINCQNESVYNSTFGSPKRKKRKFPGPAGLLPEPEKSCKDNNLIISSQVYSSQSQINTSIFEEGPWCVMRKELSKDILFSHYTIAFIKEQAISQKLHGHRAPILTGIIQNIDRNLQDPSVIIRDLSGEIQGTIHRDAWDVYGSYLVPQYSVLVLRNTSVLITGTVLKKTYLNITLKNILAIYCDNENTYVQDESKILGASNNKSANSIKFNVDLVDWNSNTVLVVRSLCEKSKENVTDFESGIKGSPRNNMKNDTEENIELLLKDIDYDSLIDDFD